MCSPRIPVFFSHAHAVEEKDDAPLGGPVLRAERSKEGAIGTLSSEEAVAMMGITDEGNAKMQYLT